MSGKEKRPVETPNFEPEFNFDPANWRDKLTLPDDLKKLLISKGYVWRFLNASEFRAAGNYHRSYWKAFNLSHVGATAGSFGATPEGTIVRGDTILGIRPKETAKKHREHLDRLNNNLAGTDARQAKELREHSRKIGLSEHVRIEEGFDDKEQGFE